VRQYFSHTIKNTGHRHSTGTKNTKKHRKRTTYNRM
jgi:hypothetical protein